VEKEVFERYLRRSGRSPSAVKRCIGFVSLYEEFLQKSRQETDLDDADPEDLIEFISSLEKASETKSKNYLWAIRYYYNFAENPGMSKYAGLMREERLDRKPFPLREFRGVDREHVETLAAFGIRNTYQILQAGATGIDRKNLAEQTGIPGSIIEEFVKLADLARIPGVKGTRARLYFEAGIDSVEKIASLEPEELRELVVDYVDLSGFEGVLTLAKEAVYTVEKARKSPKMVDLSSNE